MLTEFKGSEVLYSDDYIKFHSFSETGKRPVVILPPYAGRDGSCEQNRIDALVKAGQTVRCVELRQATIATGKFSVADWVKKIDLCIDLTVADKIDLIGDCQGGTLAAIYTALHQDRVNKLAITCAPINTKTGQDNPIEKYMETAYIPLHKLIVDLHGGIQPGMLQWLSFAMSNPIPVFFDRWLKATEHILECDWVKVEQDMANNLWHDSPFALHSWFTEWLENHFKHNRLYEGTWALTDGSIPNLADITCPLYLYQGGKDPVTHPQQLLDIRNKVASTEIHTKIFDKEGHTGPFVREYCLDYFINEFFAEEFMRI
jgi:poly(3-hydroxybutyrate) depolymerase